MFYLRFRCLFLWQILWCKDEQQLDYSTLLSDFFTYSSINMDSSYYNKYYFLVCLKFLASDNSSDYKADATCWCRTWLWRFAYYWVSYQLRKYSNLKTAKYYD